MDTVVVELLLPLQSTMFSNLALSALDFFHLDVSLFARFHVQKGSSTFAFSMSKLSVSLLVIDSVQLELVMSSRFSVQLSAVTSALNLSHTGPFSLLRSLL